ncbi:UDP-N-acetylglucosamine--N-acetylmuramyl-(pentapeptide) pyrophosphoryl-undecaprenol N-acetylglucosamine transferase [Bacillus toyonensis]|uniref:UDP-N-acetylglucosamine--N-acetylmuramyl- (pentapeptide) pyrophosphoryl-undecaprenol N-acetylglucosamine transferase n=1 Tax=Bacillus toyonensis TaxID=155322 RepID=UPI002E1FD6C5|nr:UDP-N-acetylglucosamine--N-acetylmuramyl-(pentapeptide) pyrophosphoryl-undecaprenol N-acetylglucosamine transferase [Bacillus toyonensis]
MQKHYIIAITGGGTAGHITPAISIAKSLEDKLNATIFYLGNENYLEKEIASKHSYPFFHIASQGMEGKTPFDKWKNFTIQNSKGVFKAYKHLKNIKPDFIISTGGFVTAPVLAAASLLNIPYFIHEQNTVLGRVNKLFLKGAQEVYYSFDETLGRSNSREGKVFGNPVPINTPIHQGNDIVVLGGSGGSEFLNEWSIKTAKNNPDLFIHLQAGKKNTLSVEREIKEEGITNLKSYGFVDIEEMYKKAKFVVTRGGTSSLFELANAEIPSIIVPLPNSMDNHQLMNGLHFQKSGGMQVVEQDEETNSQRLTEVATEWWNKSELLQDKRMKLQGFDYKNCANKISEDIIQILS